MKKTILVLLLAVSFTAIAQKSTRNFDVVFSIGLDPKMATEGAHIERELNKPSLDYEASFGLEWEKFRLLAQYKSHEAINFRKITYMQADYKLNIGFTVPWIDLELPNLYLYSGLEFSQIKRSGTIANDHRDVRINPVIFGANLELQYKILDDRFGIAIQASIYQAEDELKQYKKYRKDVTLTLFFYL